MVYSLKFFKSHLEKIKINSLMHDNEGHLLNPFFFLLLPFIFFFLAQSYNFLHKVVDYEPRVQRRVIKPK